MSRPQEEIATTENKSLTETQPPKRKSVSFWLDGELYDRFVKDCHKIHRQSCDIIEPWMEANCRIIEGLPSEADIQLFKPIHIKIGTMKLETLYHNYARRSTAKKDNSNYIFCEIANQYIMKSYCRGICKYGGNHIKTQETPCKAYLDL